MSRLSQAGRIAEANKVPAVTLAFWVIKILATTLGETGGDVLSMTLKLGYLAATGVFFAIFLVTLAAQIRAKRYHPLTYWAVVLATTMTGTTISDYLDRTAGFGYVGGSIVLVTTLAAVLGTWRLATGSVSVADIRTRKVEAFYWITILFSNTLGTAVGDFLADETGLGLGYEGGAAVVGVALAVVAAAYFWTRAPRTILFWIAFVLTRPLGATVGDLRTKSHEKGGLNLGTIPSSLVLAGILVVAIALFARRPAPGPASH